MRFEDTKLPDHPLLRAAVEFVSEQNKLIRAEMVAAYNKQLDGVVEGTTKQLEMMKKSGQLNEADYKAELDSLILQLNMQKTQGPALMGRELDNSFKRRSLAYAQTMIKHSSAPDDYEMIAAAIVSQSMRTHIDYKNASEKVGQKAADAAAMLAHIQSYDSRRSELVSALPAATKRLSLAAVIANIDSIIETVSEIKKSNKTVVVEPNVEANIFRNASDLFGADAKLTARFVTVFNQMTLALDLSCHARANDKGGVDLIKGSNTGPAPSQDNTPKPNKPDAGKLGGMGNW